MRNKSLFLSAAGLVIVTMIIGCSTDNPWTTNPNVPLTLSLISGPADSAVVPANSTVSFSWSATGGSGQITYQYRLNSNPWSEPSNLTIATFTGLMPDSAYTFSVQAQDAAGHMDDLTKTFMVGEVVAPPVDSLPPAVTITEAPDDSSFIATGSTIAFSWEGTDESGNPLLYQYSFGGVTSDWTPAQTVTFANVAPANPAIFTVMARDAAGNVSLPDTSLFTIKNASILYVDDYLWLDPFQNVDRVKEREQKNFYRDALRGYAFAEWDVALQGMPDSAFITTFSTVVFASDSHLGDASDTWWVYVGDAGGGVMRYYMENGGHLLASGANILQWIYNTNPPSAGDFEFDWFGIDSTAGWDFWSDFTWAVKDSATTLSLPDSMKIDVGKNGDQVDYAEDIFAFRNNAVILFVKGLDVDGAEPEDYGESVGHIFYPDGGPARSAMLNFDTFSMPLPGISQTFHTILAEFGEGRGLF